MSGSEANVLSLLAILKKARETNPPGRRCDKCQNKEGDLFVLPTRISVAGYTQQDDLTPLPHFAQQQVSAINLSESAYCLQMLREGFLYVLEERQTEKRWRVFTSTEAGFLLEHPNSAKVGNSPPPYSCNVALDGADASYIAFKQSSEIKKIYFIFTPNKMLPDKLAYYQDAGLSKLTGFTPEAIRSGAQSVLPDEFSKSILEFPTAYKIAEVEAFLHSKAYFKTGERDQPIATRDRAAYLYRYRTQYQDEKIVEHYYRYLSLYHKLKKRAGAAVVINDAIGITQSLNNRRNQALETKMKPWMESRDKEGISNEHRFLVLNQLKTLKTTYRQKNLRIRINATQKMFEKLKDDHNQKNSIFSDWGKEAIDGHIANIEQQESDFYTEEMAAQQFEKKYWSKLSQSKIDDFEQQFDTGCRAAERYAEKRTDDLKKWLQSDYLLDALDFYATNDQVQGVYFSCQVNTCLFGISSSPELRALMDSWWRQEVIGRDNLCWRAYLFNNEQAILKVNEYSQIQKQMIIREVSLTHDPQAGLIDSAIDALKQVGSYISATNGIVDRLQSSGLPIAMLSISFADLARSFLNATSTRLEQAIINRLGNFIIAGVVDKARALYNLGYNINGTSFSAPANRAIPQIQRGLSKNYTQSDIANTRLACAVFIFSAYGSLQKLLSGKTNTDREIAELTTSLLTSTAAFLQIVISLAEKMQGGRTSRTTISTVCRFGRIYLWGASMSFLAGGMTAIFDFIDAGNIKRKEGINILYVAYMIRTIATIALSMAQFLAVLGTLVPWMEHLLTTTTRQGFWVWATRLGLVVGRFAILSTIAPILGMINFYGTVIVLAITIILVIVDDDALQKWFSRCCFSKDQAREKFNRLEDELGNFYQAIEETL